MIKLPLKIIRKFQKKKSCSIFVMFIDVKQQKLCRHDRKFGSQHQWSERHGQAS
jgi:hypothetical protein